MEQCDGSVEAGGNLPSEQDGIVNVTLASAADEDSTDWSSFAGDAQDGRADFFNELICFGRHPKRTALFFPGCANDHKVINRFASSLYDFFDRFAGFGNELGMNLFVFEKRLPAFKRVQEFLRGAGGFLDAQQRDFSLASSRDDRAQAHGAITLVGTVIAYQNL